MYFELKNKVHNGWIVHGADTMSKTIEQTLLLCHKYQKKGRGFTSPVKGEAGVTCIQ